MNPLFPDGTKSSHPPDDRQGFVLSRPERRIEPLTKDAAENPAVDMIRRKIDAMYIAEPEVHQELQGEMLQSGPGSKHQRFMHELSTSGKSLAEIQAAWHQYYASLPDEEKRTVWQEFYAANANQPSKYTLAVQQQQATPHHSNPFASPLQPAPKVAGSHSIPEEKPATHTPVVVADHDVIKNHRPPDRRSLATIKKQVRHRIRAQSQAQAKAKQHLQSLAFGLGLGALVLVIFLFGLFNQTIIAPFIQPGSHAAATPIILSEDSLTPSATPEVVIPKINVQLPIVYGAQSIKEEDVQKSLEQGIFHYPTTASPGQLGNAAYFGHSSNNIFNRGKYKFAFVLLHEMEPGDIFYLTKDGKVYTYKVFKKQVVEPTETWVLNAVEGRAATATLITCDPPGTSARRLVVWGEQINPSPAGNIAAATPSQALASQDLPSDSASFWSRLWPF